VNGPDRRTTFLRLLPGLALLCAAGVLLAVYLVGRAVTPPTTGPTILSDCDGRLGVVVCSVNSARRAALHNAALFTKIVNTLQPHVRFIAMINDRSAFTVLPGNAAGRLRLVDLPTEQSFTIWTQDPFVAARMPDGSTCLIAPADFDRADDQTMTARLADALDMPIVTSDLLFEGGNIVASSRHVFIGADTIARNAMALKIDARQIARRFEQAFGRPVIVVGPLPQPVGHIDMMLTPIGDGRLMLADPAAGAAVIEQLRERGSERIAAFERAAVEGFFGNPAIRELIGPGGRAIRPPKMAGRTIDAAAAARELAPLIDRLADELAELGYRVLRVPFLPGLADEPPDDPASADEPAAPTPGPGYPTLTYNNVLLERTADDQTVYLPRYGLEAVDQAAAAAWEHAGFTVRPVTGLTTSAMFGGSLRCCVKVLTRR